MSYSKGLTDDLETQITQLRDALARYHESDIIRELLQNADDAKANILYFYLITAGECNSNHDLLTLPGLLVFNDGHLSDSDEEAIRKSAGGNKALDAVKVGRFGLGLKSIFHICDAMFYDAYKPGQNNYNICGGLFDPFKDDRNNPEISGILQQWDEKQIPAAIYAINTALTKLLPKEITDGFFILAPGKDINNQYSHILKNKTFSANELKKLLEESLNQIAPAFAQCANLKEIRAFAIESLSNCKSANEIFTIKHIGDKFLSRPNDQDENYKRKFNFLIETNAHGKKSIWQAAGVEIFDKDNIKLQQVRKRTDWPVTGRFPKPQKGLAHAALTMLVNPKDQNGIYCRWASFYPLTSEIISQASVSRHLYQKVATGCSLELLLHGYFFVDSDRKDITGVTKPGDTAAAQWNEAVKDELLLPLIPEFLFAQFTAEQITEEQLIYLCEWCNDHPSKSAIISQHQLIKNPVTKKWLLIKPQTIYRIEEDIPANIKTWLLTRNELFVSGLGVYDKQLVQTLSPQLLAEMFAYLTNNLNENDTKFIQNFYEQYGSINTCSINTYLDELKKWLVILLGKKYFSSDSKNTDKALRDQLIELSKKISSVYYVPRSAEQALREMAQKAPLLFSPTLILPQEKNDQQQSNVIPDSQLNKILKYFGQKLENQDKQNISDIILADELIKKINSAPLPGEFHHLNLFRVTIFSKAQESTKDGKDAARSYDALTSKRDANLLIAFEGSNILADEGMKLLATAFKEDQEIWRQDLRTRNLDTDPILQIYNAIIKNADKLSSNDNDRLLLFNKLLEYGDQFLKYERSKVFRYLIAGKPIPDDTPLISIKQSNDLLLQNYAKSFIPVDEKWTKKLNDDAKKAINFLSNDEALEKICSNLLHSTEPWKHLEEFKLLFPEPRKMSKELLDKFVQAPWTPDAAGKTGYSYNKILPDEEFCRFLEKHFPNSWTLHNKIKHDAWVEEVFGQFDQHNLDQQIQALLSEPEFKVPSVFFPVNMALQHLKDLAVYNDKIPDGKSEKTLLKHVLKLPPETMAKFSGDNFAYKEILKAACSYHKSMSSMPSEGIIEYIKGVFVQHHNSVCEESVKFPTRKPGVWKKGCDILDSNIDADDDNLLPEELWKTLHMHSISSEKNESKEIKNFVPQRVILEKFFDKPFCLQEAQRIVIFCCLVANIDEYIKDNNIHDYTLDWAKKSLKNTFKESPIEYIRSVQSDICADDVWSAYITLFTQEKTIERRNIAGTVYRGSKDRFSFFYEDYNKDERSKPCYFLGLGVDQNGACLAKNLEEFRHLLRNSINHLAYLRGIDERVIDKIWEDNSASQAPLSETGNLLKNDLRFICQQLKVQDETIKSHIQKIKALLSHGKYSEATQSYTELWNFAIKCPEILERLQTFINNQGYRINRVLPELLQNADDALQQTAPKNLEVTITLKNNILSLTHYGRPINAGSKNAYKQDLYNMLCFNSSEKNDNSTTGKLGLGFKSVYLLTSEPWVQSGALSFYIKNGLFPEDAGKRIDEDDYDATIFHLPLNEHVEEKEIFKSLDNAAVLVPVFAKRLSRLTISKNGSSKVFSFAKNNKTENKNYIIDQKNGVLLFQNKSDDPALALSIDSEGLPLPLPAQTPPLWHTLPLEEGCDWKLGYAINGSFTVDSGRSNLVDDACNYQIMEKLGASLGQALCQWSAQIRNENPETYKKFYSAMWKVLGKSLAYSNDVPDKKKKTLQALHANQRGLSFWLTKGGGLGDGIPEPWSRPANKQSLNWIVYDKCDSEQFIEFVENIQPLGKSEAFGGCGLISAQNAQIFKNLAIPVCETEEENIFEKIFAALTDNGQLTPQLFKACLPLYDLLPQRHKLNLYVKTRTDEWKPIKEVLIFVNNDTGFKSDYKDDLTISAFAPDSFLLDRDYISDKKSAELFVRLRSARTTEKEKIAEWIADADESKRVKALRYLETVSGNDEIWSMLKDYDGKWITEEAIVLELCQQNSIDAGIHAKLFGNINQILENYQDTTTPPHSPSKTPTLKQLEDYWNENKKQIQTDYISATYPSAFQDQTELKKKLDNDDNAAWQMLLFLGCLQSIGRMKPSATRDFFDYIYAEYHEIFKNPLAKDHPEWLEIICKWEDRQTDELKESLFMEKFLYLHQISRYLSTYICIIKKAPCNPKKTLKVFSPRSCPELSGGGSFFDTPPLPLKIGRYWILRELARLDVKGFRSRDDNFLQYCWVPRESCLEIMGIGGIDDEPSNKNVALTAKLKNLNNGKLPVFDYWFDIALC